MPSTPAPRRCGRPAVGRPFGRGCASATSTWWPPTTPPGCWPTASTPGPRPLTCAWDGRPADGPAHLWSEGVGPGRLSLERFVAVIASDPARLFGLAPARAPSPWAATPIWWCAARTRCGWSTAAPCTAGRTSRPTTAGRCGGGRRSPSAGVKFWPRGPGRWPRHGGGGWCGGDPTRRCEPAGVGKRRTVPAATPRLRQARRPPARRRARDRRSAAAAPPCAACRYRCGAAPRRTPPRRAAASGRGDRPCGPAPAQR